MNWGAERQAARPPTIRSAVKPAVSTGRTTLPLRPQLTTLNRFDQPSMDWLTMISIGAFDSTAQTQYDNKGVNSIDAQRWDGKSQECPPRASD
jgi:hypothetical protein